MANLDADSIYNDLGTDADEGTETSEILETIKKRFQTALEFTAQNRQEMLDDIRFARLGDQWPESAKYDRNRPKKERPMLVVNRLLQFRDKVVNEIRQNTPSIRIRPVNDGADQDTADVLMGLIRHIQDNSNASIAYDTSVEWQVDTGLGYIRVRNDWIDDTSFDQDIFIDRIPDPFKVYIDPHSKAPDGSDMEWAIIAEEISKDEFKRMYPNTPETQWDSAGNGDAQGWFTQDSVRVAEYYYLEHEEKEITDPESGMTRIADVKRCMWCKVTGDTILEQTEIPSKFIPIIPVVGHELFLQGRRYLAGLVRNAKDAQRLYNYYLSANAENVALSPKAPFIGVAGQFETDPNWGRANQESMAYLEYDPVSIAGTPVGAPQRSQPPQASSAIMQAIQLAENDIMQSMGIYQPSLGAQSNEVSGKALFLRQKQADTNTFHYQDNLNRSIRQVGRIILDMIPKVYDRPRVARILGEDGSPRTVKLNPNLPQASAGTDNPAIDSIFNPTIGQYDVVCDSGPSYATKRDEASQMMLTLTQANPSLFGLIGDLMVKNMDWPGAEEISRRLQAMLPPQIQQVNQAGDKADPQLLQAEQAMNQLAQQMEHMSAEIQDLRQKKLLEIQKMEREWYDAQTNRMKADVEVMKANLDINRQAAMDAAMIMQSGAQQMPEEDAENEALEEMVMQAPHAQYAGGQPQGAPAKPASMPRASRKTAGAMTKEPNIEALAGEKKPDEEFKP
jgi:hypothetical protein